MPKQNGKKKIQWHPGFVTGIDLDMDLQRRGMTQEREHNLNTKPLEIDILIHKAADSGGENTLDIGDQNTVDNEIGRIFRRYNIVEYKSPDDHMNIDTCYKANGYACLFKAYGKGVDSIKAKDVTISLFRHAKPQKLMACLKDEGMTITNPYPGIYYVEKMLFAMQIVVTRELDFDRHMWLVALSGRLKRQQVAKILKRASQIKDKRERELVDSVIQVCIAANRSIAEKLKKEDESMCEALRELMEPELRQSMEEGKKEGKKVGKRVGKKEGKREGISKVNKLNSLLISSNRIEDLKRAVNDLAYQNQLFKEFGL